MWRVVYEVNKLFKSILLLIYPIGFIRGNVSQILPRVDEVKAFMKGYMILINPKKDI